ncbi:MAG: DUF4301 family protein [Flavobacteriia bacterium]|nr:DUF4301 family protein [Flavobacteriia bacterium]
MAEIKEKNRIEEQKKKVFDKKPQVNLVSACGVKNGIIKMDQVSVDYFTTLFDKSNFSFCYFIPASGSGSRMFQFLYEFLNKPDSKNVMQIEKFFNHLNQFAFYSFLPNEIQKEELLDSENIKNIILFILEKNGLNYSHFPKGLIPFHSIGPFVLNPFQEQIVQAIRIKEQNLSIHFTINNDFEKEIENSIQNVLRFNYKKVDYSFSYQNPNTDSFAFYKDGELVYEKDDQAFKKPSGHGALLDNLQKITSDIIFLKNIDNIQNYKKSDSSTTYIKVLSGIVLEFRSVMKKLFENPTLDYLTEVNQQYKLFPENNIPNLTKKEIQALANKPIRVCGMIKNEGQPGGGPFWVNHNGIIHKQIIEKSQIEGNVNQLTLLANSSHFNPVMMACCIKDLEGNLINLVKYAELSEYFIIEKKHKGKSIFFIELPGLWNGSMAHWNTIFVEVPSETFSPVKTVLDLLEPAHLED